MLGFDWNKANIEHIARHGITPEEAEQVILNHPFDLALQSKDAEERIAQVGETADGRILVVITTWRRGLVRVVTAFPAKPSIRKLYLSQKGANDA